MEKGEKRLFFLALLSEFRDLLINLLPHLKNITRLGGEEGGKAERGAEGMEGGSWGDKSKRSGSVIDKLSRGERENLNGSRGKALFVHPFPPFSFLSSSSSCPSLSKKEQRTKGGRREGGCG